MFLNTVILKMPNNSSAIKSIFLACMGSALIGSSGIFVRLSDLGPLTTGFYRMLFALPLLALWMGWEKQNGTILTILPRYHLIPYILAGAFFAFDLALWNWSIDHTTIVNSTLFNNTAAFFVPLIMWLFFREKQSLRFLITVSIGFMGCLFLIGESLSISYDNLFGDIVALCSGLMVALYLISLKRIRDESATGFLMFWTGSISVLFLASFAYMSGESFWPLSMNDFTSILGQALLVHVLGQSLLAYSLGKIPANYVALILFLAPVSAAILGWIFYGEALSLIKIIGIITIMVSILCVKKGD
ncbi:MAG: DMT family transporter [Proteobacteria bacterium]|nr:DMT family transporter [Pseudomonadota bacterium]